MKRRRLFAAQLVLALVAICVAVWVTGLAGQTTPNIPQASKPAFGRLATPLSQLAEMALVDPQRALTFARDNIARAQGVTIPVSIRLNDGAQPFEALGRLGALVVNQGSRTVEAYVPVQALAALANEASVQRVDPIYPVMPRVVSQGVSVHGASAWHAAGLTGQGAKVGVIDIGFIGLSGLIGSELPANVTGRCYTGIGASSGNLADCQTATVHGSGVAETLMDIVPSAQLFIANPVSYLDFRQTVDWMTSQGVQVINYSAATPWEGPGDGTSPFSDGQIASVNQAIANGAVFVTSAGNEGLSTFYGPFTDANNDQVMEFTGAVNCNPIFLTAGSLLYLQLRWNDTWVGSARDLDLYLFANPANPAVASSVDPQDGTPAHAPFEFLQFTAPISGMYCAAVLRFAGAAPTWVQLQAFTSDQLTVNTGGPYSIGNPAEIANAGALAVGAAWWNATSTLETFSSRGPRPGDGGLKPEIVGVDGADTATYGPGSFFGTSQASPHVAGLAALVRQAFPELGPAAVADYLKENAQARGAQPNNNWGYGLASLGPAPDTDDDDDGLPDVFETQSGLDPLSSAGANGTNGDPDNDGLTNLQEFQAGTHPRGFFTRYLAEGATGDFFDTRIALANVGTSPSLVNVRFLKTDGMSNGQWLTVAGMRRATLDAKTVPGMAAAEFSTVVESDTQVVVDRTMRWDATGYGAHAESSVTSPAKTWYLAEGSTAGSFSLFYLLANPSLSQAAEVTVRFLLPNGAPVVRPYTLQPNSRQNIWVNQIPELASTDVSGVVDVTSGPNIIVERAMYLTGGSQTFRAGHESAGVSAPALSWFLAEGATGSYFDLFVLIANPNSQAADVQATFLLPDGTTRTKAYSVPANSRFNIWVDEEEFPGFGKALADTAVSTTITVTNGVPVVVERAMWWPSPAATWFEAHNSPGATATGTRWALAEGEAGGSANNETYILIANTSSFPGSVRVTVLFEDSAGPTSTINVPANSRTNVAVGIDFPSAVGRRFGVLVESLDATPTQIVVERAMYSDAGGVHWAAGTNALAARLQ